MRAWIALVGILVGAAHVATGQETNGGIRGRLKGVDREAVVGAHISATGPTLQGVRRAVSAADGIFSLISLPPGTYTLRLAAIGHSPTVIRDVPVQLGRVTGLGEILLPRAAAQLEEITITAPRLSIDPVSTVVGATLDREEYRNLPGERDYTSYLAILPHVNRSYRGDPVNVAGSTGLENFYFIDGVNVTAPVRAETGTRLPYNFVKAIEVKAGGYEAQYGRATGAVINTITYSGTNRFEGDFFAFLTHDALSAKAKAEPVLREASSLSYDVGIRLSGPILRDRLWYSAAYNPRLERVNREITGLGVYADERTVQVFAGKLTWQASPVINLELSLFGDPSRQDAVMIPAGWFPAGFAPLTADPYLVRTTGGGTVGSLRGQWSPGHRLLLEASLSRFSGRAGQASGATVPTPLYRDYVTQSVSGGWPESSEGSVGRTAAMIRGTISWGSHTLVAGAEYEDLVNSTTFRQADILRPNPDSWIETTGVFPGGFHNRIPTGYLQDTWRITDRVTLNAGLRWSQQTLTGARGLTAQRFPGEWQPRLGFIWQPGRVGAQRLFGSLGRFYVQEPLWLSGGFGDFEFTTRYFSVDPRAAGVSPDSSTGGPVSFDPAAYNVRDLAVEHFDELTLGYERVVGTSAKLGVRGIRRELRSSYQFGFDYRTGTFPQGTPGKGTFDFLPAPKREYTALEVSAEGWWRGNFWRGSYVLSRNWGNYSGLFDADLGIATPGGNRTFGAPNQAVNSTGLLPNDRTHVFKLSGSRRAGFGLTAGFALTVASGTPLNAFAPCPCGSDIWRSFVLPRGTAGRTPWIWTSDLRLAYDLRVARRLQSRILFDVLNLGNPRAVVLREEMKYLENNGGTYARENPGYLQATGFQRPMLAQLGLEVRF